MYASGERLPWPKPQNAQPTMQMFVKLMFRLTTKVATSPASSARSSSAAMRISFFLDHPGARLGEQRRQLLLGQLLPRPAALDRARGDRRIGRRLAAAARAAARDEAPVLELDHVEDALLHPLGVQVLGVGAEPLGQREAPGTQVLSHLMRVRERMLWRDVVTVGRQPSEVGGAGLDQLPHQSARFGGICTPTSGISRLHSTISRFMSSTVTSEAQSGRGCGCPFVIPDSQAA